MKLRIFSIRLKYRKRRLIAGKRHGSTTSFWGNQNLKRKYCVSVRKRHAFPRDMPTKQSPLYEELIWKLEFEETGLV